MIMILTTRTIIKAAATAVLASETDKYNRIRQPTSISRKVIDKNFDPCDLKLPVSRDDKKSLNSTLCFLRGISASDLVGWLIKTD